MAPRKLQTCSLGLKNREGLSQKEAEKRLARFGFNEIKEEKSFVWLKILLSQFWNVMTGILVAASLISFFAQEKLDSAAIVVIIFLNAGIGFLQEYKAEKAVDSLKKLISPHALTVRDGVLKKIPARELVQGDLIILEEGMQIPADAEIIEAFGLKCMESSLTGESLPVEKTAKSMVFMGTTISQGHGKGIVIKTGMETEFGRIAKLVQEEKSEATPLQKEISRLSRALVIIVLIIAGLLLTLTAIKGQNIFQMFLLSVSLAVSVIPEGLPAVITLTLAIGVQKMAGKNAIVRRLSAAETLGNTDVICTDKTGTLTQNEMTVQKLFFNGKDHAIEGIGYSPFPVFNTENSEPELKLILNTCALCNNASLLKNGDKWAISGDPTEGALLTLAQKGGTEKFTAEKLLPKLEEAVFDSERKRMSTLNGTTKTGFFIFTKGAPELLLEVCSGISENGEIRPLTDSDKDKILAKNLEMAKSGFRVIGFAYKPVKKGIGISEENLVFLGLAAISDPPRMEVANAISICQNAHIKVVMVTGDHALTAQAIGEKIGLYKKGDRIVTGEELENMTAKELGAIIDHVSIFARVSPHHKVKILKAFSQKGHTVAMTGDGVNDAPALKSAGTGIAMGITGTDTAKEASDIILLDDNFATIVATIENGRIIYRNIKKFIRLLLSANFDEVIMVSFAYVIGGPLPFLPLQILWLNLLTDALPAIALGVDNTETNVMNDRPFKATQSIWKDMLKFSIVAGLIPAISGICIYLLMKEAPAYHMRTVMFTSVVIFELLLVFSVRFERRHLFTAFFKNKFLLLSVALSLGFQLLAIYATPLQKILETAPLTLADWALILSMNGMAILILETWKFFQKPKQ
ncbi:MAG: cation-translocating P-type ATPase [Candidatus Gracilibacteria bacterium]|jgi:Ca2+-transporting ATPase